MSSTTSKKTICFTCSQQCGHIAQIEDGKVTRLIGDRDHPRTAGFICPKGARAHEMHNAPDRIHQPMKRIGARGSGEWETISWDQAIEEIAAKLTTIARNFGPEAVAHGIGTLHGSDYGIGKRFMNLFGSPNTVGQDKICLGPTALGEFLTYGYGPTTYASAVPNITGCLVLWGKRPSHSGKPAWQDMEKALAAGTRLLVIDPERTSEAEQADLWLQVRPGTDAALGMGLLNAVIEGGHYDAEFVATETIGFAALVERAREYPLNKVSELTGVSAENIKIAAEMISAQTPTVFGGGNGLCQSGSTAVQQGRILACLIAITGNLGRSGGHPLLGPPRDILGNGDWTAPEAISKEQRAKVLGAGTYACIGPGYEQMDEAISRAWYGIHGIADWLNCAHEPTLWRAILEADPYPVKALILQYHNPVGGSANIANVEDALLSDNLELLVSHDMFLNATSRLADYLLPAAHWLEKPHFSLGVACLAIYGDYVEANQATIQPEYEHRSDYELWHDLGHKMQQGEHWPARAEDFYQTLLDPAGLNFDEVAALNGALAGADAQNPQRTTPESEAKYGTPSGKVELSCSLMQSWGLDPLPYFQLPEIFQHATEYPLILTTGGRQIEGFHQNAQQVTAFRKKNPEPYVSIHPETAAEYGIENGQWIKIETPVGAVQQQAKISENLPAGVVHADRWWYPEGTGDESDPFGVRRTSINMCTSNAPGDMDPIMGSWLLRGLPCRLSISADKPR
jgi:thiosulfate reductase/polysulfide reductase chain A